mgnify:CR=1 FL=1
MEDIIHFYPTSDLKKIRSTYEAGLGFELYKDQGKCLIYDVAGHGKIGFCTHHPKNPPSSTCVTLVYDGKDAVDTVFGKLSAELEVINSPKTNPEFKIYHAFLRDPEGLELELQTFLD